MEVRRKNVGYVEGGRDRHRVQDGVGAGMCPLDDEAWVSRGGTHTGACLTHIHTHTRWSIQSHRIKQSRGVSKGRGHAGDQKYLKHLPHFNQLFSSFQAFRSSMKPCRSSRGKMKMCVFRNAHIREERGRKRVGRKSPSYADKQKITSPRLAFIY